MTKDSEGHVHEWYYEGGGWWRCEVKGCDECLTVYQVDNRLNEYETLKAATEALSAEEAKTIANGYALNQDHYNAVKAYAKILEDE